MAETISLSEAAQALRDHFGPQLVAGREDGRELMVDALHDDLGLSRAEAKKTIDALEQAKSIRWMGGRRLSEAPHPAQMTGGTITTESQSGYGEAAIPIQEGYWQL